MRLIGCLTLGVLCLQAQPGYISTVAGAFPTEGQALAAALNEPGAMRFDAKGNLLVLHDGRLSEISPSGRVRTLLQNGSRYCGGPVSFVGDSAASGLGGVYDFDFLPDGSLAYSAGCQNYGLRRLWPDGRITTIATISFPRGVHVERSGDVLLVDRDRHRVVRVSPEGILTPYAGVGTAGFSGDGGPATQARLNFPQTISADSRGNIWISDNGNRRIRMVTPDGSIQTVAGNGGSGFGGDGRLAIESPMGWPEQMASEPDGSMVLADSGNRRILRIRPDGRIETIAGNGISQPPTVGQQARNVSLPFPFGVAIEPASGEVFVADAVTGQIYRITRAGTVALFAGADRFAGEGGPAVFSRLGRVEDIAWDSHGNLIFTDGLRGTAIRMVRTDGTIRTIARLASTFSWIAISEDDVIYLADSTTVRRLNSDGSLTVIAGQPTAGFAVENGPARDARFNQIANLRFGPDGTLYVSDRVNHRVRAISREGLIRTVAGIGEGGYSGDGGPANQARLREPNGIAIDQAGNLFIADRLNCRLRRVNPQGRIETLAGTGSCTWPADFAQARTAPLRLPNDLALDSQGNLYISADWSRVLRLTPEGQISRIAGFDLASSGGDGGPASQATLSATSIAVDANGSLFVGDFVNKCIRRIQGATILQALPGGLTIDFALGAIPPPQTVNLRTSFGDTRQYVINTSEPWINIAPRSGLVGPGGETLTVTVSPDLARGIHSTTIRILDPVANVILNVPVTVYVGGTQQLLGLSQTGLTFGNRTGATDPASQLINVLNQGSGSLRWSATSSTLTGGNWLDISPRTGTATGRESSRITVTVTPRGLNAGVYYGLITVSSPDADNAPRSAVVVLEVNDQGLALTPRLFPYGMIFASIRGSSPAPQELTLINPSADTVNFNLFPSFIGGVQWFAPSVSSGTLRPGESRVIQIRPATPSLPAGIYRAELAVRFGQNQLPQVVDMAAIVVAPPAQSTASKGRLAAGCNPKNVVSVFRQPGSGFRVNAGWPTQVEVLSVDDCGESVNDGRATVTFSNADPLLRLSATGEGKWSGTWASSGRAATVSLTARTETLAEPVLVSQVRLSGQLEQSADRPRINADGVLHAATRATGALAPGSLISVTGSRLALTAQKTDASPLPPSLGETRLFLAGRPIPLREVSDGRVEAQVPVDLPPNVRHQMLAQRGAVYSSPVDVLIGSVAPGIFTVGTTTQGEVYILRADGPAVLADAQRPARSGDTIQILATGLGATDPEIPSGTAAATAARVTGTVKVFIDDVELQVQEAKLAIGQVGTYTIEAKMPDTLASSSVARLVVQVNGVDSPAVQLAVAKE